MRDSQIVMVAVGSILAVALSISSCATVPAGCVGVVSTFGRVDDQGLQPGGYMLNPFSKVTDMTCRIQSDKRDHAAASKDMQDVKVTLGLNYHLKPDSAVAVYRSVGVDWPNVVIPNAESETLKSEIAHHNASDILANRVQIKSTVEKSLEAWLAKYGISLDEVSVSNVSFSGDYEAAIEKAKGEAESVTIRATAQAAANEKIAASLRDGGALVVAIQQIEKWNGTLPTTLVGKDAASVFVGASK